MKWLITLLVILLVMLQYKLWFAKNGFTESLHLRKNTVLQEKQNAKLEKRNMRLIKQIKSLKHDKEVTEGLARSELGMIKRGETFYRYSAPFKQKRGNR